MVSWHIEKLILFIIVIVSSTAFIPVSCYYVRKYYRELRQHSDASQTQKLLKERYGIISFYEAIVTTINMIVTPISMAIWIYCDVEKMSTKILLFISVTLFQESLCIVFILWIYRFWLVKFKMSFTSATAHDLWRNCINPNEIEIPWRYKLYLKYKNTLGNIEWFGNIIILTIVILIITAFNIYTEAQFYFFAAYEVRTETTIFSFSYTGIRILLWAILLIVYLFIPDFQDVWFVKKELERLLWCLSVLIFALLVDDGVTYYQQYLDVHTKSYRSYGIPNGMEIICVFCKFATIMISTEWVLRKLNAINPYNANAIHPDTELKPILDIECKLFAIFEEEKQFEVFLMYLSKEFRVKTLLAFIEIVQFQKFVMNNDTNVQIWNNEAVYKRWHQVEFYDNMPRSSILQQHIGDGDGDETEQKYDDETMKDIANALFEKYMEYGYDSPWSVEFKSRDYIDEQLGSLRWRENMNPEMIMEMFDGAANDIWKQLVDSFARFEKTKEYKQIKKEILKYI